MSGCEAQGFGDPVQLRELFIRESVFQRPLRGILHKVQAVEGALAVDEIVHEGQLLVTRKLRVDPRVRQGFRTVRVGRHFLGDSEHDPPAAPVVIV